MDIEFLTYCSKDYLNYLKILIKGCDTVFKRHPVICCMDQESIDYCKKQCWQYTFLQPHRNKHISSLKLILQSKAEVLILIDADCWPLNVGVFSKLLETMNNKDVVGAGDVGQLDLPYLFKKVPHKDLLLKIHELFSTFPNFAADWFRQPFISTNRFNTGCVVDIPLLYGGLAAYRPSAFRGMKIPEWIFSADIWLSIYARENGLRFFDIGNWQFNRSMIKSKGMIHFAGPKITEEQFNQAVINYVSFLDKFNN